MTPDIGLANWFAERALRTPERKALHFEGRDWTYGEMQREIEDVAARLAALGIARGERVAFLGHNQPMFLFAMFAAARIGAIFTPLNFRLTGPELAFMLEDSASRALIVDEAHRPVIAPQIEGLRSLKAVLAAERPEQWTDGAAAAGRASRGARGRRRAYHVHLRHHRPAQGRHAHPRQFLVEQRGRHARDGRLRQRRHARRRADLPHRRAQCDDADGAAKRRSDRPASRIRSRPRARRHRRPSRDDDVRRAGDVSVHGAASELRREPIFPRCACWWSAARPARCRC